MSWQHCMVDLETADNRPTAMIFSIGAVIFDPIGEGIIDEFYTVINSKSCKDAGLTVGTDTMAWWEKQDPKARSVISEATASLITLEQGLNNFSSWFKKCQGHWLWGNGASFDNVILGNAYDSVGIDRPWMWWDDRCYRTLKAMADPSIKIERDGVYHNALDDAKDQAIHMQRFIAGSKELKI